MRTRQYQSLFKAIFSNHLSKKSFNKKCSHKDFKYNTKVIKTKHVKNNNYVKLMNVCAIEINLE